MDGLYYYTHTITAGQSTEALIAKIAPVENKLPEGYSLNVEIIASAIQSIPTSVVTENWRYC